MLQPLPSSLRRSIAFDNGPEFARHHQLSEQVDIQTFFCDVRSPWQKGGVENAIGRIRRSLPRNANLDQLPQQAIAAAAHRRSEEHTSELQTLMRISYAVFCLQKKN